MRYVIDSKKGHILGIGLVLLGLTLIFCWRLVLGSGVFFGIDMVDFYPLRAFIFNEIKSGIIPLWNPYVFCGTPTATDSCTWGVFYPLNIIFILLPLNIAFNTMVILHIFLAGISMYLFMKSLDIENFQSLVSAVIFMFSGYVIVITSAGMIDLFNGIVWIPLVFMLFRRSLFTGNTIYNIWTGIALGLQALGGHPQVTTYTSYVLLSYFLFYNISSRKGIYWVRRLKNSITVLILTLAIGFGIYAIQIIPVWEYFSQFSLRPIKSTFDYSSSYSLHPKHLITYLLPDIFSNPIKGYYWGAMNFDELGTYVGILPLLLAGYALFFSKHSDRSYFVGLGLVSLFLALGKYGFIYKAGYEFLPGFSLFRCPARWLVFTTFSLSVLAGLGISELVKRKDTNRVVNLNLLKLTVIVVVFVDLWLFGSKFIFTVDPDTYLTTKMWNAVKGSSGFYRVLPVPPVPHYGVAAKKVFCFEGGSGDLKMRDYFDFMNKVPHSINLMGGRYILSANPIEKEGYRYIDKKTVSVIEPFHLNHVSRYNLWVNIYENQNAFPRAFIVYKSRVIKNHDEVLKELQKISFNPGQEVILEEDVIRGPKGLEEGYLPEGNDTVIITEYSSNKFIVNTDSKEACFLVLGEVFYPGWKAYVDKKETKIYKANYLMRAIYLEKGRQEVILSYEPVSFKIGAGMTLLTIGCIVGFYVNRYAVQPLKRNV